MKLGIDLGTSYSSVAAEVSGKIEMIKVGTGTSAFGDSFSMPTAVYMDNGNILLGQAALNKRKISPACFKSEFKRDFGTATPYIIGEEEYFPEQLYTELFKYFKDQAVKQMGEKVKRVYITHPANYGNNKKRLIEKAANNAGLFDVVLVDEPTAAAAGYTQKNKILDGDVLLVYDLGGGTFDVALIKRTSNGYVHLAEPLGISNCGGVDFDRAIFDNIMNKMSRDGDFDIDHLMQEKRFTAVLSEISVQIKHQLTQTQSHIEPIAVGFDYFNYTITRQEFECMIRPFVANTCEKIRDILKNSGLVASDIDKVLLVGGSSRVPLVQKMVYEVLKKEACFDADPELAVCFGAVSLGIAKNQEDTYKKKANQKQDKRHEEEELNKKIKEEEKTKKEKQNNEKQKVEETFTVREDRAVEYPGRMSDYMKEVIIGNYASDGEWIYYINSYDNYTLYKIKINGTHKIKLSNNTVKSPIKIEGEWVYYNVLDRLQNQISCYRIKNDGSGETRINQEYTYSYAPDYVIKNGWIYFVNSFCRLRRVKADGSDITTIGTDKQVGSMAVEKDRIFYTCFSNSPEDASLCSINLDGTSRIELCKKKAIIKGVFDNWVYYGSEERGLWKISSNGTGNCKILNDYMFDNEYYKINIIDKWLYYKGSISVCRVLLDGTSVQVVTDNMLQQVIASRKM